jgi:hypothetical protein
MRREWRWGFIALAIVILFVVYLRLSWSAAANSDSAATALQARDALHGNWLLHGWWMSDVSFYTTEVPQYALLEMFGFGVWVVHVAAAMSYTLIVVLVALLAAGRRPAGQDPANRERLVRAVLAGGIAASPQVSDALMTLLGPDHTGTVVPVLATWLFIDRVRPTANAAAGGPGQSSAAAGGPGQSSAAAGGPGQSSAARLYVPALVCVFLTWIMVADSVVLFTGIAPLIGAAVIRALQPGYRDRRRYELILAAAAVVAAGLGTLIPKLIVRLGGYQFWHFQTRTAPIAKLPHDLWDTVQAVLELFGANVFEPHSATEAVLVSIHFAGVLAAIAALVVAVSRFFREDAILIPALTIAILLELGAFLGSIHSTNLASEREIVAVMPFGAVLAGRLLAAPLLRLLPPAFRNVSITQSSSLKPDKAPVEASQLRNRPARKSGGRAVLAGRWRPLLVAAAAAVVVVGYLGGMLYDATRPSVPSANQPLATWLAAHGLTGGLASYWEAGSVTLDTAGRVQVNAVAINAHGKLRAYLWETDTTQYQASRHTATFVVAGGPKSVVPTLGLRQAAIRTFGPRRGRVYQFRSDKGF